MDLNETAGSIDFDVSGETTEEINESLERPWGMEGLVKDEGVIGYYDKNGTFLPRTNFDLEITGCLELEGQVVGYLFIVKREDDIRER